MGCNGVPVSKKSDPDAVSRQVFPITGWLLVSAQVYNGVKGRAACIYQYKAMHGRTECYGNMDWL